MTKTLLPSTLTDRIQRLLNKRQEHAQAIAQIDSTLEEIGGLLGVSRLRRKRQAGTKFAPTSPAALTEAPAKRKRQRKTYATTAEESILAFVKQKGRPTTQQIKQHWASEERRGTADNVLSHLVKDEKLKRTPLKGQRGSSYLLP